MYVWQQATNNAAYSPRDGAGLAVQNNKLVLVGGYLNSSRNDVWASSDGIVWTQQTAAAPWAPRHSMPTVEHNGRIFILGGDALLGSYQPDVWSTNDCGVTWRLETASAPWGNRVLHFGASFAGYLWVWGGQTFYPPDSQTTYFCDAWRSLDGITWEKVGGVMPWGTRNAVCGSAVLDGELFVIAGGCYDTPDFPARQYKSDVWKTSDGINWTLVKARAPFAPRIYHSVTQFNGELWVMGGRTDASQTVDVRDVWRSPDRGATWIQEPLPPWPARHAASVAEFNGSLYLMAGANYAKDVWRLTSTVVGDITYGAVPNSVTGWGNLYTIIDRFITLMPGATVSSIGVSFLYAHAGLVPKIFKENSATNYDVVFSGVAATHPGGGYVDFPANDFVVPATGTYRVGLSCNLPGSPAETFCTNGQRAFKVGDITGNGQTYGSYTDGTIAMRWTQAV